MAAWVTLTVIGGAILTLAAVVKVVIPVCRAVASFFREVITALHIFNGRGEFVDEVTGKKVDEVPPLGIVLAGIRSDLNAQGKQITSLTAVVQEVADQRKEINALRNDVDLLKAGTLEKAAIRIESASLMDMVTKRDSDVIDPDPGPEEDGS